MLASAVAIGLCLYVAAGVLALVFARATLPPDAGVDPRVGRYHAMLQDYAAGWRAYALAVALAAYGAAAIALFSQDAAAVYWLAGALIVDCMTFFLWPQRRLFVASLSPQERMSDAGGVAALTMALALTAYLRFSGALA